MEMKLDSLHSGCQDLKPLLAIIYGGSERKKLWRELHDELLRPGALDDERVAALQEKLAPKGKLTPVSSTHCEGGEGALCGSVDS